MIIISIVTAKPVCGKSHDHYLYSNCQACLLVSHMIIISIITVKPVGWKSHDHYLYSNSQACWW